MHYRDGLFARLLLRAEVAPIPRQLDTNFTRTPRLIFYYQRHFAREVETPWSQCDSNVEGEEEKVRIRDTQ